MVRRLPSTTAWVDVQETLPPPDTWLVVLFYEEDSEGKKIPDLKIGYWSSRAQCFVDENALCIDERHDVVSYALLTKPDGSVFEVDRNY